MFNLSFCSNGAENRSVLVSGPLEESRGVGRGYRISRDCGILRTVSQVAYTWLAWPQKPATEKR
jgi:hypothetical protein